ncbi:toxin-antitoxin system YwqK family antitoxin [Crocinitomix catalasitica]|uniref:toxin-antitoxin system YwqK family antitoxin n=1 Tax=Crocinitomix catalasitica TaxID=184607 RepID=UPI000485CA3E|nr:hypothetical protein [Crocinitomix catalasitica]
MSLQFYTYLILILVLFTPMKASAQCDNSTLWFDYGGYSDTTVATLYLKIDLCDKKQSDANDNNYVSIVIANEDDFEKKDSILIGVTKGILFNAGIYKINLSFKGYQPTEILNYEAIPDQISSAQILLGKNEKLIALNTNPYVHIPKNGIDTIYHENKTLKGVLTYSNDKIIKSIFYYDSGNIRSKYEVFSDTLFSKISFYPNGQLEFITTWNKGLTTGYRKDYYENGSLKQELFNTSEGQLNWTQIDSNGIVFVKNGNSVKSYWRAREKPEIFGYYKNGHRHGLWLWRKDGQIFKKYRYKYGVLVLYEFYDSEGNLYRRSTYNKQGIEKKTTYNN